MVETIRVLLVDDDEDDYLMTRDLISDIPRNTFEIDWVATYDAGLDEIKRGVHDIYFLDYKLGQHTGLQLLEAAIAAGCDAPIVLLTGQQDVEIDIAAARAGAFDYLVKGQADATLIERTIRYSMERKQAEQLVRRQSEILSNVINHIPHSVFWMDAESRYLGCNANFAEQLGLDSPDAIVGKTDGEIPLAGGVAALLADETAVPAPDEPVVNQDRTFTDGAGAERTYLVSRSAISDSDGAFMGLLGMFLDVSEDKRAERERLRMEDQLRQAQKLESIGRLAAGIAHEINTPTQYIGDNVHFLRDAFTEISTFSSRSKTALDAAENGGITASARQELQTAAEDADLEFLLDEVPRALDQTLQGIETVANIVRAMKEFSHPGTGSKEQTDINRAIQTTISVSRNEWKYAAEVVTDLDSSDPVVPLHVGDFNQAVLNIIVNAAHAIQDSGLAEGELGTITITTRCKGGAVEVSITDTGAGVPEELRDKLFDPFFTTKEVGRGTGQGLAIAYAAIVDKHGGSLTFETESGAGTTFVIRLPLAADSPALETA